MTQMRIGDGAARRERPADAATLETFVGFYAVGDDGRAWRVIDAWRDEEGGWQATVGPDGMPGPTLPTTCAHVGPKAKPPGWRRL